jgi:methyl-accepting chemotaxis protein
MAVRAVVSIDVDVPEEISAFAARMEVARSRLEERFLEGGSALLAILDVLNRLIGSLDQAAGSLDEETANATMSELQQTVARLSQLSENEKGRQTQFGRISEAQLRLKTHAEEMQETLRYLRTFAVTAKITGAGIADFAGFAEEILQRIHDGTRQVNDFSGKVQYLGQGLGSVITKGQRIVSSYEETVPQIVSGLSDGGAEIDRHRKMLIEQAASVRTIARGIQTKLASTLSAMQIGDITRQRIEHCQSTLTLLDDFLASPEAAPLSEPQRDNLSAVIRKLVSHQLRQSIDHFDRDTAKIVSTVASFRSDLQKIDAIRETMAEGQGGDTAMRQLETGVEIAREAVRQIEAVAGEATELSRSTGRTVSELVTSIGVVQLVRTDIHYMALNTNLRCGRIGDQGKAINVVAAELRNYAGELDGAADKILVHLRMLEESAQKLSACEDTGGSLDLRLEKALANIRVVGDRMETEMLLLGEHSRSAVGEIDASLGRLDFKAELGEVLRACAEEGAAFASARPLPAIESALAELGTRISRLYTMVSERELHAKILGTAPPVEAPVISVVMTDDDIDDALF